MMRAYELMVIIDGDVDDPKAQSYVKVVTDAITAARKETGYYLVVEALAPAGSLRELERSLRIADEVVRHKLIKLPSAEAARRGMSVDAA